MATSPKFDTLVGAVEKAETALVEAKGKLQEAVESKEEGFVTQINGVPYHVTMVGEKKELRCMLTKRQIAAVRGEPVPPMVRRKKAPAETKEPEAAQ